MTRPDSFAALRHKGVARLIAGRFVGALSAQVVSITIGWQLYEETHSAWALGIVGLVELIPAVLLALPAGAISDRFSRKRIAVISRFGLGVAATGFALWSRSHAEVFWVYGVLFVYAVSYTFHVSALEPMIPQLVPPHDFINANAWLSGTFELASMGGPALGGFLIAATGNATLAFSAAAAGHLGFAILLATVPDVRGSMGNAPITWRDLSAGLSFVWSADIFLAAITLDLFAVLFGGATALLPIFAKDILHVGPEGLGLLRTAPAIGALIMAVLTTRLPPWKRSGPILLWAVAGFGIATIGFGLSRNFLLSFVMLMLTGFFDNISVVIRRTLEQVLTPNHMRGRVSAVHHVFIAFSNELGSFESGTTAALFGPVLSVVGGGIATLAVIAIVIFRWPVVRSLGALSDLKPISAI